MGMVKHSQSFQNSNFAMFLQYLKNEIRDEMDFWHADKHHSFLQVDFNTLGIKLSYKVILSLFMGEIKHSQSTLKLVLLFLMEVARHVQSTQNRKLVIFLQYINKKCCNSKRFYCDAKHSGILRGSSYNRCYLLFLVFSVSAEESIVETFLVEQLLYKV